MHALSRKASAIKDKPRIRGSSVEWHLNPIVFERCSTACIDLFASSQNNQLPIFCSWGDDPVVFAHDAMTISWDMALACAFPPIALIPRVLERITNCKSCVMILITPRWPRQPWFPRPLSLLVGEVVALPLRKDLILTEDGAHLPRQTLQALNLTAWQISSDHTRRQAFQAKLQPSLVRQGDLRQEELIIPALGNTSSGAGVAAVNLHSASLGQVCEFLTAVFKEEGATAYSVRSCRTAVAAVHHGFGEGNTVSNSPAIHDLFHQRLPSKSLVPAWDLPRALRPLADLPPPIWATSSSQLNGPHFLVAAACGRRVSEIQALSVVENHIRWSSDAVHLLPRAGFLTKNQTLDFTPKLIVLPDLREASGSPDCGPWCPVRALKFYIDKTAPYRGDVDSLFLTVNKPIKKASKQTMSRWIASVIKDSISAEELSRWVPKSGLMIYALKQRHGHYTRDALSRTLWMPRGGVRPQLSRLCTWRCLGSHSNEGVEHSQFIIDRWSSLMKTHTRGTVLP